MQARHLAFIFESTTDIRHIEHRTDDRFADALSRNILVLEHSLVDLEALAYAQRQNDVV